MGRSGVAQPVGREPRQAGLVDDRRERSVVGAGEHEPAGAGGDDQVVVLPLRAGGEPLGGLLGSTPGEHAHRVVVDRDRAS